MSGCIINLVTVMNKKKKNQNMNLNNVIVSLGIESQYMIFFNQCTKKHILYHCKGENHLKQSSKKEIWIQVLGNDESKIRINGRIDTEY